MTFLTCGALRHLAAFHDRELPIRDLIDLNAHVSECDDCARELAALQAVGSAVRMAAMPGEADDWSGLQASVISRMRAEAHESWSARTGRLFDDMHLVWIGLASTAATFLCGLVALGVLHFAAPQRNDSSLAAMIHVISAPIGSNINPLRADPHLQVPSVPGSGPIEAMLARPISRDELTLALSAVVTREGRVSGLLVLDGAHPVQEDLSPILDVLSRGRLEPGRLGASPVAVNLVWLVTHTTVRPKHPSRSI